MEVIERDAIALWWHGGAKGHRFAEDDPILADLRAKSSGLRVARDRDWWLLDITTDLEIPVVVCLSSGADGGTVICGFGAALHLSQAAESAFLEMCQMEFAQEHSVATSGKKSRSELKLLDQLWLARHRDLTLARCPQFLGTSQERRQLTRRNFASGLEVIERLHELGFPVYWVNLTRQDLGVPVVKVLVPGLQSPNADWQSPRLKATAIANGYDIEGSLSKTAPI
jgi:ribosomal protein S12 methylthiotransferase accessory factor